MDNILQDLHIVYSKKKEDVFVLRQVHIISIITTENALLITYRPYLSLSTERLVIPFQPFIKIVID